MSLLPLSIARALHLSPAETTRLQGESPVTALPWVPTLACLAALSAGVFWPAWAQSAGPWVWVVALVVLGMPHGAADWAVHQAAAKRDHRRGGLIGFTPYLLWMAACGALLWLLPVWACVAFFALTALHFGLEDVDSTKPKRESSEERRGPRGLLAVLRGGPVLLIPFAVAPAAAWQPFALVTGEPITASLAVIVAAVALTLWIASAICLGGMLLINPLRWAPHH